ncbi:MAG TPA: glycosyltransferase family 2 protein [Actinomycetota bacterium]|jgi:glycosyltransferase involved in cell wall biosynthesis
MPTEVEISAVVCTLGHDLSLLKRVVESLARQSMPAERFEVLVVVNGPDPAAVRGVTRLLGDYRDAIPNLSLVHEPRLGVSHARSLGLSAARAEIVAYLDDDGVAEPDWLETHRNTYRRCPAVAALGGRVDLEWPTGRPSWLVPDLEVFYSRYDLGPDAQVVIGNGRSPYPIGTNMSFRKSEVPGRFSARLGHRSGSLISNEEDEMCRRLQATGGTIVYEPDAVVHHVIRSERVCRRWLVRRTFAQGRSDVISAHISGAGKTNRVYWLGRAGRAVLSAVGRGKGALIRDAWRGDGSRAFVVEAARVSRVLGRAREGLALALVGRGN